MALSTQPYKGARDFYPEEKRLQKYIFGKLRAVVERFGYEEYDAPILEPFELYSAKTGEEIVNEQTYVFEDRGGRRVVIRPEMTPTVSRMVAAKRQHLSYPLRWYSIPNLWRYERPQRGRLREHWQLNVDVFGIESTAAEIELISLVDTIFNEFGASRDMYEIKINSRPLMSYLAHNYFELNAEQAHDLSKLVDRMQKMSSSDFVGKLDEILTDKQKQAGLTEKIMNTLAAKSLSDLPAEVYKNPEVQAVQNVLDQLGSMGISNAKFDITIMRGFDYYTGIVFEAYDTHPDNNRSMMGGGRYDGLVGLFGVDPVATVGFGWGDVTLSNFLELHRLLPDLKSEVDLYVALTGNDLDKRCQAVLSELRRGNVNVAVDYSHKKIGDQIKTAVKKGIPYLLVLGDNEIKSKQYVLRLLASGKEQSLNLEGVIKTINSSKTNASN